MEVAKICVFCASGDKCDKSYLEEAENLGKLLALNNKEIIYGGGKVGLMGALAKGALSNCGRVTGVIPEFMVGLELANNDIHELNVVDSMHKREDYMMRTADCIIVLPGSIGTYSELFQSISWKFLGLIRVPIIVVNFRDYFRPALEMLNTAVREGFMQGNDLSLIKVVDSADDAIALICNEILPEPVSTFLA